MNTLEDSVLRAVDAVAEESGNRVTKQLVDLFKSAVLKKYKVAFDEELKQGSVHRDNVDKAVDFCFAETCVMFRQLTIPEMDDEEKEKAITHMKQILGDLKDKVRAILKERGVIEFE